MSYLKIAESLKLDMDRIGRGEVVEQTVVLRTPQEARAILCSPAVPHSLELAKSVLGVNEHAPDSYAAGLKHFHAYCAGLTELDTSIGKPFFDRRFPMTLNVAVGNTITLNSDIAIGPGAPPYLASCDTLIIDGGSYTVESTSFTLWVTDHVEITSNTSGKPYHIAILGTDGADGADAPDQKSQQQAPAGTPAGQASPGICTGRGDGGDGHPGHKGYDGVRGGDGKDGVASVAATINIKHFSTPQPPLLVLGRSGRGGSGGKGGKGGAGQQGGDGGSGCDSGCECTNGGAAGSGGDGGKGGDGGNGGNGVNGSLIYFNVDPAQTGAQYFTYTGQQAGPGSGGGAGLPGDAGQPGAVGSTGHTCKPGASGAAGAPGAPGSPGQAGTNVGIAPQWVTGTYTPPH